MDDALLVRFTEAYDARVVVPAFDDLLGCRVYRHLLCCVVGPLMAAPDYEFKVGDRIVFTEEAYLSAKATRIAPGVSLPGMIGIVTEDRLVSDPNFLGDKAEPRWRVRIQAHPTLSEEFFSEEMEVQRLEDVVAAESSVEIAGFSALDADMYLEARGIAETWVNRLREEGEKTTNKYGKMNLFGAVSVLLDEFPLSL